MTGSKIKVCFIAAEAGPLITAGGLGEVAYALPRALTQLPEGHNQPEVDIRVFIPNYPFLNLQTYQPRLVSEFNVPTRSGELPARVYEIHPENRLIYYLVDGEPVRNSSRTVYSFDAAQDGGKFTFLSVASLLATEKLGWQPDLIHANDWHTAPAIYWLYLNRTKNSFFARTASLLNIHNLPYHGEGAGLAMNEFGLPPTTDKRLPAWARNVPLPLGLLTADQLVAVSPGYAQEILTPEFGAGMSEFLNTRTETITGILNGIDPDYWNPETDAEIPTRYSVQSLPLRLENKHYLLKTYGLAEDVNLPLITMITRFDQQKGVDLALDALLQIAHLPWQAILLGTGHPDLEKAALRLQELLPERVRALIMYDKSVSRKLYAGSDMILIPSRYEPCGLVQMIAMRYGCLPIARETGGLRDTIQDYTRSGQSTGFLFQSATPEALAGAIRRALHVYSLTDAWQAMQIRGMQQDFSWKQSARQYASLYYKMVQQKPS
jgi:starch synthase